MDKLQLLNAQIERIRIADASLFTFNWQSVGGRLQKVLAFIGAPAWTEVYGTNGTMQLVEPVERTENGPLANQAIELFYPGAERPSFFALERRHLILELKFRGEDPFILGTTENPWLATAGFSTERKGYTLNFARREPK